MKKRLLASILVLTLTLLSLSAGILSSFKSETLAGEAIDASFFKGHKVTMVNVWATYCSPCLREMPDLEKLSKDYKDKGLQILGIIADVSESNLYQNRQMKKRALSLIEDTTKVTYTNIVASKSFMTSGFLYNIQSVPTTFFVNEEGEFIAPAYVGINDYESWAKIVDGILESL